MTCSVESLVGRAEGVARDEIDVGPLARGKLKVNKERISPSSYLQNSGQAPRYLIDSSNLGDKVNRSI